MREVSKMIEMDIEDIHNFKVYLLERENANSTIRKYLTDVRTFYRFLEGNSQVDKMVLLQYKSWLMEHYEISSANSMIVALNQYLECLGAGYMKIKRIKTHRQQFSDVERELTKKEYERLVRTAKNGNKKRLVLALETMGSTGIRVSELGFFTVERIKKGRIKVYNKGKLRTILITKALQMKLLFYAQKEGIEKGAIFITRSGSKLDRSNLWKEMKALGQKAGVAYKKIFPHNLRHLFARTYYSITKDLFGLADLLGHSSLEVTRMYAAISEKVYQKRIENLGLI